MKGILISIAMVVCALSLNAQDRGQSSPDILRELDKRPANGGEAELIVPAEVGVMMKSHIAQNKRKGQYSGYRIQILSANSSQKDVKELEAERDRFEENFPDIPAYLQYTVPDFKIRVGNYRNKLEAIPDLYRIRRRYPNSYAVKCTITEAELNKETLATRRHREEEEAERLRQDSLNAIEGYFSDIFEE